MSDQRHNHRVVLMQDLFACTFTQQTLDNYLKEGQQETVLFKIVTELPQLDTLIQKAAPERPLSEINKVDLAILRLIVFESKHKKTPKKVLLNEAIELAKSFSSDNSPGFVNGVLAKIVLEEEKI